MMAKPHSSKPDSSTFQFHFSCLLKSYFILVMRKGVVWTTHLSPSHAPQRETSPPLSHEGYEGPDAPHLQHIVPQQQLYFDQSPHSDLRVAATAATFSSNARAATTRPARERGRGATVGVRGILAADFAWAKRSVPQQMPPGAVHIWSPQHSAP